MRTSVIARCNPPPVFDPGKAVLNFVALFVKRLVVGLRVLAVFLRRDAGLDAFVEKRLAKAVAIVALIAGERFRAGQLRQHQLCAFVIAHLTGRQKQNQGLAVLIGDGVQFRVQPALRAPETRGTALF